MYPDADNAAFLRLENDDDYVIWARFMLTFIGVIWLDDDVAVERWENEGGAAPCR